jgi:hypothetical protein
MKGVLRWLVRWHRFVLPLAAVVGPVQNIFSSPNTNSIHLSKLPKKLAGQAVAPGRLSLNMCLWWRQ